MKQLRSLFLLMLFALLPFAASAQDKSEGAKLDIPEIVLEHLSDFAVRRRDNGRSVLPKAYQRNFSLMKNITERFMNVWLTALRLVRLT